MKNAKQKDYMGKAVSPCCLEMVFISDVALETGCFVRRQ